MHLAMFVQLASLKVLFEIRSARNLILRIVVYLRKMAVLSAGLVVILSLSFAESQGNTNLICHF